MSYITNYYNDIVTNYSDPRTTNWPMISSPIPTLLIVIAFVIFTTIIGPQMMKDKKPFKLLHFSIAFNAMEVLVNIYMFYMASVHGWLTRYSFICQPPDYSNHPSTIKLLNLVWWFYIFRLFELFDSILMVLEKRYNVLPTTIIHHSSMCILAWIAVKFVPEGHFSFSGYISSFVHIFIYSYCLVAALGPKYKKYLWWKYYLLQLQMVQFVIIILHCVQTVFSDCKVLKSIAAGGAIVSAVYFYLIYCLYKSEKRNDKKSEKHEKGNESKIHSE